MSDAEAIPANHDEARRLNQACPGQPKYFTYPAPQPPTEEEQQRYEEAGKKIDELLAREGSRRRRRRR